ncbi:MAG TPA: hypothetical protein VJT12_01515 [Methyloceanibacter sp.]|nr:hypothetical protein [Methyloceanibacter sp.]
MRVRVRVTLVLAAYLLAAQASSARAEENLIWTGKASEGQVSLSYAPLDPAKPPLFLLSCFDAMGIAVLDLRQEIANAKLGDPLTIALSASDAKAEVKGEAARDEAGTIFAEASDIAVKPVLEVLRQTGPVTATAGTASVSLSDTGRAQAVERFTKDCPLE